jgi:hypothetical protein
MQRRRGWIVFGLTLASTALLVPSLAPNLVGQTTGEAEAPASAAPVVKRHHKSHKIAPPIVLPPMPAGPLHQLPMDQIPATPAKVTFEGGLLTISAQNSTLAEILRDVRKLTGASIEIPAGANERVVANLGPGAPRDVLVGLLNGCSFNYVMLGSNTDPMAVSSVILTSKSSAPGDAQTVANVYPNNAPPQGPPPGMEQRFPHPGPFNGQPIVAQPANGQTTDADDSKDDDADNADDNADDSSAQVQLGQAQPDGTPAADQQVQPDPNQPNAGPKTPEQILEMLRRSQPGGTPPPPPQQPEQ